MICTLPELEDMLTRANVEYCTRVCPVHVHGTHRVKNGKLDDTLQPRYASPA